MLLSLNVKDFALIEDIEINFKEGLTVLTGETGAGKSIILESLSLIFAKRSDQEMIRHGKEKAIVEASFNLSNDLQTFFELDKSITIKREIDISGRHRIYLNDKTITLGYLKQLTDKIGSIHSQNDLYQLLDQELYLGFIDQMEPNTTNELISKYLLKRSDYLDALKHLEKLKKKEVLELEQKEFLEYQLKELNAYNFKEKEKLELVSNISRLKNYDKTYSNIKESLNDFENINIDLIYATAKRIEQISKYDNDYLDKAEKLNDIYYELTDIKSFINNKQYDLDFDQNEFDLMQERLYEIERLEKKYKKDFNELITYIDLIKERIELIDNYDGFIEKYQNRVDKLALETKNAGLNLRKTRMKLAKVFEKEVIKELKDLDLENTKFNIVFNEDEKVTFKEDGIDQVEFYISLNEGEPIKPLSKVASGGERARFMFAIKTIYAKQNNLSLLVLDEIDIGISGKTAAKMAKKMQVLSEELQLIVITHLPQVAARANTHYGINKSLINNRMQTTIKELTDSERIEMIALMLSDESLSHFAIEQAKMLLKK